MHTHNLYIIIRAVTKEGLISAKISNPAVSEDLLREIHMWRMEGTTDIDVITRLRQRTVPEGYTPHFWCPG